MYKAVVSCIVAIVIVGSLEYIHILQLDSIHKKVNDLQLTQFVVSEEPQKIATTLIQTYPYLKIWGSQVIFYWSGIIYDQCERRRIDWRVVCAKIHCESGFNPKAISNMDAKGIAQVLDSTAVIISRRIGMTYIPDVTLMNDVAGMLLGIEYLDQGIKREKSIERGLKCYYAGSNWRKNPKQGPINEYAKTVIDEAHKIGEVYQRLYPSPKSFFLRPWN